MDSIVTFLVWASIKFLRTFFLRQELDVINQQHIHIAELVAEAGHLVVAQRVDHLVGKLLARQVADRSLGLMPFYFMSNGLHQVGLSHTYAAVQEQRVVGLGGTLCDRLRRGMGELVARAFDESVEGITRV